MKRRTHLLAGLASLAVLSAAVAYEPVPLSSKKTQAPATGTGSLVNSPETTTPANARDEEIEIMRRLLQSALQRQCQPATLQGRLQSAAFSPDAKELAVEVSAPAAAWRVVRHPGADSYWVDIASGMNAIPGQVHGLEAPIPEGVYLNRYGVVYTAAVCLPPMMSVVSEASQPGPKPLSDWERTRRELRGEKTETMRTPMRESLADTVLKVLAKNGQNFTTLDGDLAGGGTEQITVSITLRKAQACTQCHAPPTNVTIGSGATSDVGLTGSITLNERYFDPTRTGTIAAGGVGAFTIGNTPLQPPLPEDVRKLDAANAEIKKQVLLGDLHMKQGKNEQAAAAFEAALKIYGDSLESGRRLGRDATGPAETIAQMEHEYRIAAAKLLQVYAALGKKQDMQLMLKRLEAELGKASAADGAGKSPPPVSRKQELPAKLVITAPKKLLEMAGSGKITFEEFRKNATVDYQPPKTIEKHPAKAPSTE